MKKNEVLLLQVGNKVATKGGIRCSALSIVTVLSVMKRFYGINSAIIENKGIMEGML